MLEAVGAWGGGRGFEVWREEEVASGFADRQGLAEEVGEAVGLQTLSRTLDAHHRLGDLRAGGDVAGGDQALGPAPRGSSFRPG